MLSVSTKRGMMYKMYSVRIKSSSIRHSVSTKCSSTMYSVVTKFCNIMYSVSIKCSSTMYSSVVLWLDIYIIRIAR